MIGGLRALASAARRERGGRQRCFDGGVPVAEVVEGQEG
jgi:hypothetical protein